MPTSQIDIHSLGDAGAPQTQDLLVIDRFIGPLATDFETMHMALAIANTMASANADPPGAFPSGAQYYNQLLRSVMTYDAPTGLWLGDRVDLTCGRQGNTLTGEYYRTSNGVQMNAVNKGIPVRKGMITRVLMYQDNAPAASSIVIEDSTGPIVTISHSTNGQDTGAITIPFSAGLLKVYNDMSGSTTIDMNIHIFYKLII